MFIKNANGLVFIKSENVKVFPSGRRSSTAIDIDNDLATVSDRYYIPFDPEARLNTEANNRKHSGLNGFKQSYLLDYNETDGSLSIVLAGYLFNIQLNYGYRTPTELGTAFAEKFAMAKSVYANIKLANVALFGSADTPEIGTEILRDQVSNDTPAACLDFLIDKQDKTKRSSYYFSGLSFSAEDKTAASSTDRVISLKILQQNSSGEWEIYEPSKLPAIDHGDTENSVKVGDLTATGIKLGDSSETAKAVAALEVTETALGSEIYQLVFSF
jgi:hypothetical protein